MIIVHLSLSPSPSLTHTPCVSELMMLDSFDHIFWFGDLNYRVELTRDQANQHLANSDWMVSINFAYCVYNVTVYFWLRLLQSLLLKDQLTQEILHGKIIILINIIIDAYAFLFSRQCISGLL